MLQDTFNHELITPPYAVLCLDYRHPQDYIAISILEAESHLHYCPPIIDASSIYPQNSLAITIFLRDYFSQLQMNLCSCYQIRMLQLFQKTDSNPFSFFWETNSFADHF